MGDYIYGLDIAWCTGVSIYDINNNRFVYLGNIDATKIKLNKEDKKKGILEHSKKLKYISDELEELSKKYPPKVIVIERYFSRFANATVALAKIHGVINELFHDIPQIYYPPKTIKEALVHGSATKEDLQIAINAKYNDISFANEDESDSFAVLLTYLVKENLIDWEKPKWSEIKKLRKPKNKK